MTARYKTVQFTLRPTSGILDKDLAMLNEYVVKWGLYYHVITEKLNSERHAHCFIILKEEDTMKNFNRKTIRYFNYIVKEGRGKCVVIRNRNRGLYNGGVVYNEDWYAKYLAKGDDTTVWFTKMCDADERATYYKDIPVEERRTKGVFNGYYRRLEALWKEEGKELPDDPNPENDWIRIRDWMAYHMAVTDKIETIHDDKLMRRKAKMLHMRLTQCKYGYPGEVARDGSVGNAVGPPRKLEICKECSAQIAPHRTYTVHDS